MKWNFRIGNGIPLEGTKYCIHSRFRLRKHNWAKSHVRDVSNSGSFLGITSQTNFI